jgi:antibiotic biosynthesis monooxygenase (ABM) superfamily enzyme
VRRSKQIFKDSAVWKEAMLVLLVLYPIVMVEFKFLFPAIQDLPLAISTFISLVISVTLITWPMMPLAVKFLGWWLSPKGNKRFTNWIGTGVVLGLYLLEILFFWRFVGVTTVS